MHNIYVKFREVPSLRIQSLFELVDALSRRQAVLNVLHYAEQRKSHRQKKLSLRVFPAVMEGW